jgi:hypothetical protein
MSLECDVALLGTGVAPLVAATHLLAQGLQVVVLNPDHDFFLEDSELPLDPLLELESGPENELAFLRARLQESLPERALEVLRPDFPGAIEFWSGSAPAGFHDRSAPHVRQRDRLWLAPHDPASTSEDAGGPKHRKQRERVDALYVECSDLGFHPQIVDEVQALKRFPGASGRPATAPYDGFQLSKLCDVDVSRYRSGLLEFLRERLGPERLLCSVSGLALTEEGLRFHAGRFGRTLRAAEGTLVFWTPRLTHWILDQAKRFECSPVLPSGIRCWEQWVLSSRDPVDLSAIGVFEDMLVWGDIEGPPSPDRELTRLSLLRSAVWTPVSTRGELRELIGAGWDWASAASLDSIQRLCLGFLKWDHASIRGMRPRVVFEWDARARPWGISVDGSRCLVVPECDGPLVGAVRSVRRACAAFQEGA